MEDDHLQFGHLLDGVWRSFFAQSGVLKSAVRHHVGPVGGVAVDVQVTRIYLKGNSHGRIHVLR